MQQTQADFTLTFRRLVLAAEDPAGQTRLRELFGTNPKFDEWLRDWRERLGSDPQPVAERVATMRAANPAFIPRNHRVQTALDAADGGDYSLVRELVTILLRPYDDQPDVSDYGLPPNPAQRVLRTFCGT